MELGQQVDQLLQPNIVSQMLPYVMIEGHRLLTSLVCSEGSVIFEVVEDALRGRYDVDAIEALYAIGLDVCGD